MTKPIYLSTDYHSTDGQTIYWFDVDGEQFGVVEGYRAGIVDFSCVPLVRCDYHRRIELSLRDAVTDEIRAQ